VRLKADRSVLQADGEDLSLVTVEAVDAQDRPDLHADRNMQFSISGPGVIAAVGNANGQDPDSYHGDHSKLYQGRALVVIRTSQQTGTINLTAQATGLSQAAISLCAKAANRLPGLMVAPGGTMRGGLSTKGRNRAIRGNLDGALRYSLAESALGRIKTETASDSKTTTNDYSLDPANRRASAFTSAFKELDPNPQFKTTAKLVEFLADRSRGRSSLGSGGRRSFRLVGIQCATRAQR